MRIALGPWKRFRWQIVCAYVEKRCESAAFIKHKSLVAFKKKKKHFSPFFPLLFLPTLIEASYNLKDPSPHVVALFLRWPHYCAPRWSTRTLWRSLCFYCVERCRPSVRTPYVYLTDTRIRTMHRKKRRYPWILQSPRCILS